MSPASLWGVYREQAHSPGRENDDEAILNAVAARVAAMGLGAVRMLHVHELPERDPEVLPDLVFYMCESVDLLARFTRWEARGVEFVNPVQGARNTFRTETVRLLGTRPFFPASRFLDTDAPAPTAHSRQWVKRGDYHAVCPDDVVDVASGESLRGALDRFGARGIARVVVQDHVEGDLIKFYGVRDAITGESSWFRWFYHRDQELGHHPVDELRLRGTCMEGAGALGLEVFGGDVIVTPQGELFAIDFNAWPSFALYRDEAAEHIAAHVGTRFESVSYELDGQTSLRVAER